MNRTKYLAKNTFIFFLGNFGSKIISFLMVPLYTGVLSKEQYGVVDLASTICMVAVPFLFLNIWESVLRFPLDKDSDIGTIMSATFIVFAFSILPAGLLYLFTSLYSKVALCSWYILFYTISFGMCQVFLCYLRGREFLVRYAIGSIIQSFSIAFFNILFLVVFKLGIRGYFISYITSYSIVIIYVFLFGGVFEILKNLRIDRKLTVEMVKYSTVLIPNSFMWWIMNSADRIMVTELRGVEENGVYAVSYKLPTIITVITSIFNQAYSYSAIKNDNDDDRENYNNMIFDAFFTFVIFAGMILLLVLKVFMAVYVPPDYFASWEYSQPLIIGSVIMSIGTYLSAFYVVNKDGGGFTLSALTGALINLVCNMIFIPLWGAMGASIATCLSYFVVVIYRNKDVKKYIQVKVFTINNVVSLSLFLLIAVANYFSVILQFVAQVLLLILFMVVKKDSLFRIIGLFSTCLSLVRNKNRDKKR